MIHSITLENIDYVHLGNWELPVSGHLSLAEGWLLFVGSGSVCYQPSVEAWEHDCVQLGMLPERRDYGGLRTWVWSQTAGLWLEAVSPAT